MPERHFPVYPNLEQLKHQAKDLLRAEKENPTTLGITTLAEAQRALARSYGLPSWTRLVLSCRLINAIRQDDVDAVRTLVLEYPKLIKENARGTVYCNWGPPMSYAANLGKNTIIEMLRSLGADDIQHAFDRACLQGKLDTAQRLHAMGALVKNGMVMGPCETLNGAGLQFLLDLGSPLQDAQGDSFAPIALILETYSRSPAGKHHCLELVAKQGIDLPDTPPMAVHRGRIDLLEQHLRRDPDLLTRTFSHQEIYPPMLGCHEDETLALHGTPLAGATLLHLCVDYDEIEIARWLIEQGMDVNAKAAVDSDGFGGHTALFGCVVSQSYRSNCRKDDAFARLLLENGADTTVRASLRKQLRFVGDETLHKYPNVTPLQWGEQFHDQDWVSPSVLSLLQPRLAA
jgi:hypothetical protein